MAKKLERTHAMRALEARGIPYRAVTYDVAGEFHSGEEAAVLLGVDAESVYKTLVVLREPPQAKPLLVMVPAARQIDLKLLAAALGEKRLRMATRREAETLTGMQAGGISALALQKPGFDIVIDATALELREIHMSGGRRGLDLALAPGDFISVTKARAVAAASLY